MRESVKKRIKKMETRIRPAVKHLTLADLYSPEEIAEADKFLYGDTNLKKKPDENERTR